MSQTFESNNVAVGIQSPIRQLAPKPIIALRNPNGGDKAPVGNLWVNTVNQTSYICQGTVAGVTDWGSINGGAGIFSSLTVTPGPINLTGTTNINHTANAAGNTTIGSGTYTGIITLETDAVTGSDIVINASGAGGGVNIDSGSGGTIIETSGLLELTSTDTTGSDVEISASGLGGGVVITSSSGGVNLNPSVNQPTNINTGTSTGAVNIGNAAAGKITMESNNGTATAIDIVANNAAGGATIATGTGGFNVVSAGIVTIAPATGSVASATATQTINANLIVATFTGFTTAAAATFLDAGAIQTYTIVSNKHTAGSGVIASIANKGTNDAKLWIMRTNTTTAGTIVFTTINYGTAALNGDVVLTVFITD